MGVCPRPCGDARAGAALPRYPALQVQVSHPLLSPLGLPDQAATIVWEVAGALESCSVQQTRSNSADVVPCAKINEGKALTGYRRIEQETHDAELAA
jgi:hypothetical protein